MAEPFQNTLTRRDLHGLLIGAGLAAAAPAFAREPADWRLGFQTSPEALDGDLKLLSGRLPNGLSGVLYRAGPAQFERNGERLGHWFDGDGMIQRFDIAEGRVRHRGRFVDTPKRRAEAAAGRFLYSGYGFSPRDAVPFTRPDEINAANTNVLALDREIWALWEGGSPYRLDRGDLSTIGPKTFGGDLSGLPFSAHPKRDRNGDLWNFGGFGPRLILWRLGSGGDLISATPLDLPQSTLMHDFAITVRHIVLIAPPMREAGGEAASLIDRFVWSPAESTTVLVVDKDDPRAVRTYELPAKFLFHIGNAYETRDGAVHIDAFLFDDPSFAIRDSREMPQGVRARPPAARPTLIRLDADGSARLETLPGTGEFPRIDPRRQGARQRYTYGVIAGGCGRWDWRGGRQRTYEAGATFWAEEPVFVPRRGADAESAGWILQTRLNLGTEKTELLIFDARAIEDGPIAELECAYPLPLGFHGAFAPF